MLKYTDMKTHTYYSMMHLREALADAGLPNSRLTILKYERLGIIPAPQSVENFPQTSWRFYTLKEIEQNVQRVRAYINSRSK